MKFSDRLSQIKEILSFRPTANGKVKESTRFYSHIPAVAKIEEEVGELYAIKDAVEKEEAARKPIAPAPVTNTPTPAAALINSAPAFNSRQSLVEKFLSDYRAAEAAGNALDKKVSEARAKEKVSLIQHRKQRFSRILERALSDPPATAPNFNQDMQEDAKRKLSAAIDQEAQGYPDGPSQNPYDIKDSQDEVRKERIDGLLLGNTPRASAATVYNLAGQYWIAYDSGRAFISIDSVNFVGLIRQFGNGKSTPGSTLAAARNYYTDANGQKFAAGPTWAEALKNGGSLAVDQNNFPVTPVAVPDLTAADVADLIKNTPPFSLVQTAYRFLENPTVTFDPLKHGQVVW
jgi:hypothetical protein